MTATDHEWLLRLHEGAHRELVERAYGPWEEAQQRGFFSPLLEDFEVFVFEQVDENDTHVVLRHP